jgi:hypothetical protein
VFRIAVYCEGPAESGAMGLGPSPGTLLEDDALGAAHVLVRRAAQHLDRQRFGAVSFEEPLRLAGARPRGSQLLSRNNVRRLLAWASPQRAPDLSVLLVDEDGDEKRLDRLRSFVAGLAPPFAVVAVAVREFEGWLLADHKSVAKLTGRRIDHARKVESLAPGAAKAHLRELTEALRNEHGVARAHRTIAEQLDLDTLVASCASFKRFVDEFRECAARTPERHA